MTTTPRIIDGPLTSADEVTLWKLVEDPSGKGLRVIGEEIVSSVQAAVLRLRDEPGAGHGQRERVAHKEVFPRDLTASLRSQIAACTESVVQALRDVEMALLEKGAGSYAFVFAEPYHVPDGVAPAGFLPGERGLMFTAELVYDAEGAAGGDADAEGDA